MTHKIQRGGDGIRLELVARIGRHHEPIAGVLQQVLDRSGAHRIVELGSGSLRNHRSDVITEILDAKAVVCASPTLNNGMMPLMGQEGDNSSEKL